MNDPTCIEVSGVDLVFGTRPGKAFQELDQGKDRDYIQKKSGMVVGVRRVSLDVKQGEILVLMGLSGSGKSSLLRCLNGMNGRGVGTLRGKIKYTNPKTSETWDVMTCSSERLRQMRRYEISMVFQAFGLMPWRTVFENVAYPLEIQKTPKEERSERVLEKLKLVGLSEWKDRLPEELSGGMQQRVGLARAFVTQAPVLLMDEPFSALDPLHKKHLQDEVLSLQRQLKKTIVFVSHDLKEALRIGSRIAIMDGGEILQIGTAAELVSNPSCERVSRFTAEI
ncbi:MAG: ATP-binding cassette domain-containing protein [Bdellovibrio sp.]|nr:ATP-binding cassette domain-containing protein [Bdellovibrio sp.]